MHRRLIALAALLLTACGPPRSASDQAAAPTPPADAPEAPASAPASSPDAWVGRWTGPEGLFLQVGARDAATGAYPITLKDNLDSQADYQATAMAGGLTFHRGDDLVTIRAGTGAEAGFKYLAGKRDCLILVAGAEGYCRD